MENSRETLQAIVEFSKQAFFSNSENKMNLDNSEIINTAILVSTTLNVQFSVCPKQYFISGTVLTC